METLTFLPLRSAIVLRAVRQHDEGQKQRRSRHGGNRLDRRALGDEGHGRTRAERDVEAVGRHRLLHLGVAGKRYLLDVEAVLLEEALADADVERHERKCLGHGFADAQRFGSVCGCRGDDTYERRGNERYRAVHRQIPPKRVGFSFWAETPQCKACSYRVRKEVFSSRRRTAAALRAPWGRSGRYR